MRYALPLMLLCAGCGLEYQGASPSLRTMQEDPAFGQYYVGANANFAVTPAGEGARPAPVVAGQRNPLDIWNTPVADVSPAGVGERATTTVDLSE
jgi:hypothetical protein